MELFAAYPHPARLLYADGGFTPSINNGRLTLGPEQLALIGTGQYANSAYELGRDSTIHIPQHIIPLACDFHEKEKNTIVSAPIDPASFQGKTLRIIMQQFGTDGLPVRSWGGAPPDGKKMSDLLQIHVSQAGEILPLRITYDKIIWSGLSWAAAELMPGVGSPSLPLTIECTTTEQQPLRVEARLYILEYENN